MPRSPWFPKTWLATTWFAWSAWFACCAGPAVAAPDTGPPLKRRADLGAAIAPPADGKPARIAGLREDSVLARAGLRKGDEIVRLDGRAPADENAFFAQWRSYRGGDRLTLEARRGEQSLVATVVAPQMRRESIAGLQVQYGQAMSAKGYRVRTYATHPEGANGRLPVVAFIPWLSCGPVENPLGQPDGWSSMLEFVMRESGALVVRIEKPGLGDSEGPDCSQTDLSDDLEAFRAGIRAALAHPRADPDHLTLFGGSIGMTLAPVLAREFPVKALVVSGGMARTWHEHILGFERRRLALSGRKPAELNADMKKLLDLYAMVLGQRMTPGEAIVRRPDLKEVWNDAPGHQFGRRTAYYQQLQDLDVEGAWSALNVPTLVVWGEYDWIMSREDQERVVSILNATRPGLARLVVRPRMNHHFELFADPVRAFQEEGGEPDTQAARIIVQWLKGHGG